MSLFRSTEPYPGVVAEHVREESRLEVGELERRVASLRRELAAVRARQDELGAQVEATLQHSARVEQLARDQSAWFAGISAREPALASTPDAARASAAPLDELVRLNEDLVARAQRLEAQLRAMDGALRSPPGTATPAEQPARSASPAEEAPRERAAPDVLALREELQALERRRQELGLQPSYLALLAIAVVGAGVATAVGLAVAGHGTAAVVVLAAFALGIAPLSVSGPGPARTVRSADAPAPPSPVPPARPTPVEPAPPPPDAVDLQLRLAELARARARLLVELGIAVEAGDERAAATARSRLRDLDALIAAAEAAGDSHGAS